jgi:hypothetical protein
MRIQTGAKRAFRGLCSAWARHDHEIPGGKSGLMAERLPRDAFQSVSIHCPLGGFARNGESEPRNTDGVEPCEDRKKLIGRSYRIAEDAAELLGGVQASLRRKPCGQADQRRPKRRR